MGRSVWEVIPGLVGSRFQAEAFRALVEQSEVEFEGFFAPLKRWFSVRITPTRRRASSPASRDVTGWRQTRRVLTREAERLAAVIETQQAVATAGPDLGAVMRVVAERLQALTWASAAGVFVPDDDGLVLCEASGSGRERIGLTVSSGVEPRRPSATGPSELMRCDDLARGSAGRRRSPSRCWARAPAISSRSRASEHGVQAVVAIWSGRPRAFNDLHVHTIRLVAGLLSAALERARPSPPTRCCWRSAPRRSRPSRAREERFRTLVESIDDVVFRLDRDQRCVDIFGRWLQREGFEPKDFLGRTTAEIVGTGMPRAVHERANLRALAGETVTYEWTRSSRRGHAAHADHAVAPARPAAARWRAIVGVGRDITQRIEAEQQVRQAQKMEAVGRFAGGVAHDLNNMIDDHPRVQRLPPRRRSGRRRPRRGDADEIRKAAERGDAPHPPAARVRPPAGGRAARCSSLNTVVEGMERMLRPLLGEDITLVTSLGLSLGGVEADYGQMEQVVMNLTLNARDAMRTGGELTIETTDVDFPEGYAYRNLGVRHPGRPVRAAGRDRHRARHDARGEGRICSSPSSPPSPRRSTPGSAWPRCTASWSRAAATSGWTPSRARAPASRSISPRGRRRVAAPSRRIRRGRPRAAPRPCCWSRTRTRCACWRSRVLRRPRLHRARGARTGARRWRCWPGPTTASTWC